MGKGLVLLAGSIPSDIVSHPLVYARPLHIPFDLVKGFIPLGWPVEK
jgi:hypothetical protein